jgi:hypothetical protein
LDAIGLKKKIITTNSDIIHYDFYSSENILVIPPAKISDIELFLKIPYKSLDEEIRNKYSLHFWIKCIISGEKIIYSKIN